jgi:hypothetical protein
MNGSKYAKATMPTPEEALGMARERDEWAREARERDLTGTAHEYELTALLLRFYAGATKYDDPYEKPDGLVPG